MKPDLHGQLGAQAVLVTGGAGSVGSHLVRRLLEHEATVTVLDNLETGSLDDVAGLGGYRFIRGSVPGPHVTISQAASHTPCS